MACQIAGTYLLLDFFSLENIKPKVYTTSSTSLQELCQKIVEECQHITSEMLQNDRRVFEARLYGGYWSSF